MNFFGLLCMTMAGLVSATARDVFDNSKYPELRDVQQFLAAHYFAKNKPEEVREGVRRKMTDELQQFKPDDEGIRRIRGIIKTNYTGLAGAFPIDEPFMPILEKALGRLGVTHASTSASSSTRVAIQMGEQARRGFFTDNVQLPTGPVDPVEYHEHDGPLPTTKHITSPIVYPNLLDFMQNQDLDHLMRRISEQRHILAAENGNDIQYEVSLTKEGVAITYKGRSNGQNPLDKNAFKEEIQTNFMTRTDRSVATLSRNSYARAVPLVIFPEFANLDDLLQREQNPGLVLHEVYKHCLANRLKPDSLMIHGGGFQSQNMLHIHVLVNELDRVDTIPQDWNIFVKHIKEFYIKGGERDHAKRNPNNRLQRFLNNEANMINSGRAINAPWWQDLIEEAMAKADHLEITYGKPLKAPSGGA